MTGSGRLHYSSMKIGVELRQRHASPGVRAEGCQPVLAGVTHVRLGRADWRRVERQAKTEARPSGAAPYSNHPPE